MEPRTLDLQAAFMRARVLGEDVKDYLCPVERSCLELPLEVALLARAEVVVADDDVEAAFQLHLTQLVHLSHADEVRRIHSAAPLDVGANDLRSSCARQVRELS